MSHTLDSCSSKYEKHEVSTPAGATVCVFCLDLCSRAVNLESCTHLGFLEDILSKLTIKTTQDMVTCLLCHRMLVKCSYFQKQVEESCQRLNNQADSTSTRNMFRFHNLIQTIPNITEMTMKQNNRSDSFSDSDYETLLPTGSSTFIKVEIKEEIDDTQEISENNVEELKKQGKEKIYKDDSKIKRKEEEFVASVESKEKTKKENAKSAKVKKKVKTKSKGYRTISKDPKVFTCQQCGENFEKWRALRYHREKHAEHQCEECGKRLINTKSLKVHMQRMHTTHTELFPCNICGKRFKMKMDVQIHIGNVHNYDRDAKAYCPTCDIVFKTRNNYSQHLKKHSAHVRDTDKKYECGESGCGRRFLSRSLLQKHIEWDHLHTSRYKCSICNKRLSSKSKLQRHIAYVHEKIPKLKDRICDICGRAFADTHLLQVHLRTHTGERPLWCSLCNASFAAPATLYTHRKLVHKVLPANTRTAVIK